MLNRIIIMGRLTRDPELRHTQSGTAVASFSLAVDRDFKSQNGEKETDFIDVVAWRNSAEFVSRYFTKGRMAVVEGRLQIRDWTDRDGGKRRSAEVVADNVYFGDSKRDSDSGSQGGYVHRFDITEISHGLLADAGGGGLIVQPNQHRTVVSPVAPGVVRNHRDLTGGDAFHFFLHTRQGDTFQSLQHTGGYIGHLCL